MVSESKQLISILIVEDNLTFRAALAGVLEHLGHTVHCVSDSRSMYQILADHPIDCILLDWNLAGENGLSLAEQLRNSYSGIIVMLSGYQQPSGLDGFIDLYLLKPVNPLELHTTLLHLISGQPHNQTGEAS